MCILLRSYDLNLEPMNLIVDLGLDILKIAAYQK